LKRPQRRPWRRDHNYGLPWLDRYSTKPAITDEFLDGDQGRLGMTSAGPLDIVSLLLAMGDQERAEAVFRSYLGRQDTNPHHRPVIVQFSHEKGLDHVLGDWH
jgi:hypothetical protein